MRGTLAGARQGRVAPERGSGEDLNDVVVFTRVVERGGMSAAAAVLGIPKSTISRRVAALESRLGVRLLERTSRAFRPTSIGKLYYERCRRIVADLEEASALVHSARARPRGVLRVTAPIVLGRTLMGPLVAEYRRACPEVRVFVDVTNRRVDLVEEEFDVAIRVGPLADSTLVARRLGSSRGSFLASPSLLSRVGHPREPRDLAELPVVLLGRGLGRAEITLERDGRAEAVEIDPVVVANDLDVARAAIVAGEGVGGLPEFLFFAEPHGRELVPVLPGWRLPAVTIYAIHASHKGLTPAIRAFVDLAAERFSAWLDPEGAPALRGRMGSPIVTEGDFTAVPLRSK